MHYHYQLLHADTLQNLCLTDQCNSMRLVCIWEPLVSFFGQWSCVVPSLLAEWAMPLAVVQAGQGSFPVRVEA